MPSILQEPCPQCGKTVEGKLIGWVRKKSVFPAFCGHCGIQITSKCSHCNAPLSHLTVFCPNCRTQLYLPKPQVVTPSPPQQRPKPQVPERARRVLTKTWTDTKDGCVFLREMYRRLVWNNPVQQQVNALASSLNEIGENTEGNKRADIIEGALGSVNLDCEKEWAEFEDGLWEIAKSITSSWADLLNKTMPECMKSFPCVTEAEGNLRLMKASLSQALNSRKVDLDEMRRKLQQLREFCPRFRGIVTRMGLLDLAIRFAARCFGGGIGAVGTELWQNWRAKSDEEFLNSFGSAIDDFIESSNKVSAAMEDAVDGVVIQVLAGDRKLTETCVQGLARMAALGTNLEPVLRELEHPAKPDPKLKDLHVTVLASLREKNLIDLRAESNLRTMLGIA